MRNKGFATPVLVGIATLCFSTAHALENKAPYKPTYAGWIKYLTTSCPKLAADVVSDPRVAPMFKYRPADIGSVCECTVQRYLGDQRLQAYLDVEPELLARHLTPQIQAYGAQRVFHSVMTCLVPEMDRALNATPFE